MFVEHIFYNLGIALLVPLVYKRCSTSWSVAIILATTYLPDLDHLFLNGRGRSLLPLYSSVYPFQDGGFHNIGILLLVSLIIGAILYPFGIKFYNSSLLAGIGFCGHLLEDALVYHSGYAFLWPFSSKVMGIGLFAPSTRDFFGIANTTVLLVGILFCLLTISLRLVVQRRDLIGKDQLD